MSVPIRRSLRVLLVLIVLSAFLLAGWVATGSAATEEARAALQPGPAVQVFNEDNWIVFTPRTASPQAGFIFYPGGRVAPEAYAPVLASLAEQGYLVALARMPLNLAVLAPNRASEILATYPEIKSWAIGGHSLGGVMAAAFADSNAGVIKGLVLWAAYPAASNDLSERSGLAVLSIYGTLDGLAAPEQVLAGAVLLPFATQFVPIAGGNHSQFGSYGLQNGDIPAQISAEEQHSQIVVASAALLAEVAGR